MEMVRTRVSVMVDSSEVGADISLGLELGIQLGLGSWFKLVLTMD